MFFLSLLIIAAYFVRGCPKKDVCSQGAGVVV